MYEWNEVHSETYRLSAVIWTFTGLSSVLFGMRMSTRIWNAKQPWRWDDLITALAWAFSVTRTSLTQVAIYRVRGIDLNEPAATLPPASFALILAGAWAVISIQIPRISIGLLLVRVFNPRRSTRFILIAAPVIILLAGIPNFFWTMFRCSPAAAQWNPFRYPNAVCMSERTWTIYSLTHAGCCAALDLSFAVYPGFVIWNLQMATWKKVSTSALMGLGLASFAFALTKLISAASLLHQPDLITSIYRTIYIDLWNSLENDFVLSAACLPFMPQFIRHSHGYYQKLSPISSRSKKSLSSTENVARDGASTTTNNTTTTKNEKTGVSVEYPMPMPQNSFGYQHHHNNTSGFSGNMA